MMGTNSSFLPPSLSSSKEMKELFELVSDFKKSKELLGQIHEAVSKLEISNKKNSDLLTDIGNKQAQLDAKEAEFSAKQESISKKEAELAKTAKTVAESVSAAVKKSKELETLQASLAQEKQSFSAEMEQGKQMVASLSAAAEEKAKEYRALVAEYNSKLAKLKELAGG